MIAFAFASPLYAMPALRGAIGKGDGKGHGWRNSTFII